MRGQNIEVKEPVRKRLKVRAAKEGLTYSQLIDKLLKHKCPKKPELGGNGWV